METVVRYRFYFVTLLHIEKGQEMILVRCEMKISVKEVKGLVCAIKMCK